MSTLYVFQHAPHEGLGNFEKAFRDRGFSIHYYRSYQEDLSDIRVSQLKDLGGLVVMGGPMSANDEGKLPFIREELRILREGLTSDVPILGVCLGSQMLAKALGSKVYRGKQKEIGWYPIRMQSGWGEDPLTKKFPEETMMFHWHGETFDLPPGAVRLASSDLYANQAFRYGTHAYGLQFHPEMSGPMVEDWVRSGVSEIVAARLPHGYKEIEAGIAKHIPDMERLAPEVVQGFASLIK